MVLSQSLFDELCANFLDFRTTHSILLSSLGEEGFRQHYGPDVPFTSYFDFFGPLNDILEAVLASKPEETASPLPVPQPEAGPSNLRPQRPSTPDVPLPEELIQEDTVARAQMEVEEEEAPLKDRKGKGKAKARRI